MGRFFLVRRFREPVPRALETPAFLGRSKITAPAPSSTLWGAALFVLHGFYGAVKERIRTARAPRPRNAPPGRFRKHAVNPSLLHQAAPYGVLLFCFAWILWSSKERIRTARAPRPRNAPGGAFSEARGHSCSIPLLHQAAPYGVLLFFLHGFLHGFYGAVKSGFEQPVPRALETPRWAWIFSVKEFERPCPAP